MTKLETFLRKERVLNKFIKNLKSEKANGLLTDKRRTLNGVFNNISESVMSAFIWKDTPEGFDFWDKLDVKFRK